MADKGLNSWSDSLTRLIVDHRLSFLDKSGGFIDQITVTIGSSPVNITKSLTDTLNKWDDTKGRLVGDYLVTLDC